MTNIHEIFNNTDLKINYPNSYIELFENNLKKHQENKALVYKNNLLTYKELNEYGNKLAHYLKNLGVTKNDRVGIYIDECIEMISAIIGILKASASFVPMPDIFPTDRVNDITENAKIKILLTKKNLIKNEASNLKYVYLDEIVIDKYNNENLLIETNLTDCIYNIYTSGSTGKPKGVSLSNQNILNFTFYIINRYEITKNDNFSKFAGFGFDASIIEIMPALISGATLHILDKEIKKDIHKLNDYFEENNITISFLPTQFAEIFMEEVNNKSLRCLYTGGEKLKKVKLRNYKIYNIYGPTETTVAATFYEVNSENLENIPIGKPIDNYKVYIVNKNNDLCRINEEGELCIAGEGVGLGYIDLPKLNSEKFIPNPYLKEPNNLENSYSTIYKTGDLAKWLPDGNIEYIGRIDFQVKIRGFRIELGEIEQKIIHYPGIKEAVAVALKDPIGQDFICAYYTTYENGINEIHLIDYLNKSIPEYMIPQNFVYLKEFPINANGKVDRKSLPFPLFDNENKTEYIAPKNEKEEILLHYLKEIFKRDNISLSASFISIGGNSLQALILLSKLRTEYDITTNDILNSKSLSEIATKLIKKSHKIEMIKQKSNKFPATFSQKGIYYSWRIDKQSTIYNTPVSLEIKGNLNLNSLEEVINSIIIEQRILRTNFIVENDNIFQVVKNYPSIKLNPQIISTDKVESSFYEFIKPFNLETEPLIRFKIFSNESNTSYLFIDIHHIINDGYSQNLLVNEIIQRYEKNKSSLNKKDYLDYSIFEKDLNKTTAINFWKKQLNNFENSNIPYDFPEIEFTHTGAAISQFIPSDLMTNVKTICQKLNITEYCFFLSAFIILNYKLSRKNTTCIGAFFSGRCQEETQNMLGMFVATLPIITKINSENEVADFLQNIQKNLNIILDNQEISLNELIELSELPIENGRNPFFSNAFNFVELFNNTNNLSIKNLNLYIKDQCHFDLTAILFKIDNTYEIRFEYNTNSYKKESITSYLSSYLEILNALVQTKFIKNLNFITQNDKNKIINNFNNKNINFNINKSYIEYFHNIVNLYPNSPALKFKETELTYSELNKNANKIAALLINNAVNYKDKICLYFNESQEMITTIIATLKTSASFIPIADTMPKERIYEIFNDSGAKYILTNSDLFNNNFSNETNIHNIITIDTSDLKNLPEYNPVIQTKTDDCLYSIYTSGSTGKPKGVSISNLNVTNFSLHMIKEYNYTNNDCFTKIAGYSFDASILEIMPCLLAGGYLHIIPKEIKSNIEKLNNYFNENNISVAFLPTQFAEIFMKEANNTSLKYLIVGGDRLKKVKLANYKILNGYGPTEATIACSIYEVLDDKLKNIPIGKPLSNYKIYISDEDNNLCPIGVAGELCIAGEGVALEYINLPKLNTEKFIPNPFLTETEKDAFRYNRLYKSGDLARWQNDGNLEFIGRIDSQVKIRGYRIELNEIEQRILELSDISECIVLPINMSNDHIYLCAYYVGNHKTEEVLIKNYLAKFLPDYMIPEVFYYLSAFPINQNGKIDRKKLPIPIIQIDDHLTQPESENEKKIYAEFQKVIQTSKFGIDSNFFRIGGNSLKAVQIVTHLAKDFNIEVSDIFNHKTIRNIAKNIKENKSNYEIPKTYLEKYPLTSSQKGIYLASIMQTNSTVYNIPLALEIRGQLNKDKLGSAIDKLLKNNRVLQSYFILDDNEIYSKINKHVFIKKDFQKSKYQELETNFQEFTKSFQLNTAPLVRVKLIQLDNYHHVLFLDIHHIINDGFSENLILNEIFDYYFDEINTKSENSIDFLDFSIFEKDNLDLKNKSLINWQKKIDKIAKTHLPFDYPEKQFNDNGDSYKIKIQNEKFKKINDFCQNNSLTIYTVSIAAYYILIYKVTRTNNLTVGGFFSGRYLPELQNMLGMFVSSLPIYFEIDSNQTNLELLHSLQNTISDVMKLQNCSIEEISQLSSITNSDGRNKFFNNAFNFIENINNSYKDINVKILNLKNKVKAHFDLTLNCIKDKDEIEFNFEYSTASYKRDSIIQYANCYINILLELTNNEEFIKNISFITKDEKTCLLEKFNQTNIPREYNKYYIDKFYQIAKIYPQNPALVFQASILTYEELNKKTNQLAQYLINLGVDKSEKVLLYFDESLEMASSIIAVLKTGASFIPVADSFPINRVIDILTDATSKYIITKSNIIQENSSIPSSVKIITIDTLNLNENSENNIPINLQRDDYAYHIYTSGSTGKPKGVSISQKNIINLCDYYSNLLSLNANDSYAKYAGYSFDASLIEILPTLVSGAALHILNKEIKLDPIKLNNYFEKNNITNCFLPTQFAEIFMHEIENHSLRNLITGGEKLKKVFKKNYHIFNQYGPSETTVVTTSFEYDGKSYSNIPIGKPIDNFKVYVTDPDMNLCPIGIPGELCISGDGVGLGYIGLPELNKQKFITNPFINDKNHSVIYKTGDLVQWLPDGNIEFIGRIDFQVKIRGFRIELGEIDYQLSQFPEIEDCLVLALQDESKQQYLCAYYTAEHKLADNLIKTFLMKHLPDYMIPEVFYWMPEFPINANGKIDRKHFPKPQRLNTSIYVAPRSEQEKFVATAFSEVLGITDPGVYCNFFEAGGNSLKAIQLVTKIQKNYDIKISDIFSFKDIENIAKNLKYFDSGFNIDYRFKQIKKMLNEKKEHIVSEKTLNKQTNYFNRIQELKNWIPQPIQNIQNILILGGAGFLGSHIILEQLATTQNNITVLLRANNLKAQDEFINSLNYYSKNKLTDNEFKRIKILSGDLNLFNFGLTEEQYYKLQNCISSVINCAANVKHYGEYSQFYQDNVETVKNIINFCTNKIKLHHISTYSVSMIEKDENKNKNYDDIFTEYDLRNSELLENYYLKTKAEAENIIRSNSNLKANIYRVGNLVFNTKTGLHQINSESNGFYQKLKCLLNIDSLCAHDDIDLTELSPINNTAEAIVLLSQQDNLTNEIFHIFNENLYKFSQIFNEHNDYKKLVINNVDSFIDKLSFYYKHNYTKNILNNFLLHMGWINLSNTNLNITVVNDKTKNILNKLNFSWDKIDGYHFTDILTKAYKDRITELSQLETLKSIDHTNLTEFNHYCKLRILDENEIVYPSHAKEKSFHIILNGFAQLSIKSNIGGWISSIGVLSAGDFIGLENLFDYNNNNLIIDSIFDELVLLEIDEQDFNKIKGNKEIFESLFKYLLNSLNNKNLLISNFV